MSVVGGDCGNNGEVSEIVCSGYIVQVLFLHVLSLVEFLKLVSCIGGLVVFTGRGLALVASVLVEFLKLSREAVGHHGI